MGAELQLKDYVEILLKDTKLGCSEEDAELAALIGEQALDALNIDSNWEEGREKFPDNCENLSPTHCDLDKRGGAWEPLIEFGHAPLGKWNMAKPGAE